MIIDFEVANFRSIKDPIHFSFEADTSKSHRDNYFEAVLDGGKSIRLLKTAVMYGANASGKSNFIKALFALRYFVVESHRFDSGEPIECHEPFLLDRLTKTASSPVVFKLTFIGNDHVKYVYEIRFTSHEVQFERLDFFPEGNKNLLFERSRENGHTLKVGRKFEPKVSRKFAANKLVVSVLGNDAHEQLEPIYIWFKNSFEVGNVLAKNRLTIWERNVRQRGSQDPAFREKLVKLMNKADTGIEGLSIHENADDVFGFPEDFPSELKRAIMEQHRYGITPLFKEFDKHELVGLSKEISWENQSSGTQMLFTIGGLMLMTLETGGIIVIDELNSSLHPDLCAFLVNLFHNSDSNPKNAQLLFATHDVQMLSNERFRKDQFWLTKKNKFGETEVYSAQDFTEVRDTTPLDKWYISGKFFGKPRIKETEFIYG